MRIVSQDGKYDIPYEKAIIRLQEQSTKNGIQYLLVAELTGSLFRSSPIVIGKYTKESYARYALGDISSAYNSGYWILRYFVLTEHQVKNRFKEDENENNN